VLTSAEVLLPDERELARRVALERAAAAPPVPVVRPARSVVPALCGRARPALAPWAAQSECRALARQGWRLRPACACPLTRVSR